MKEEITKFDPAREYFIDEGCFINELSTEPGDKGISIARARVEKGVTTDFHRLKGTIERYVILEGTGRVEVGELPPADVSYGDVVHIPAMVKQRITNTGDSDLIFLCICSPRFEQGNYEDLESR